MSNPYEQILRSAAPPRPKPKPAPSSSGVLSKANKKKPVSKPHVRFNIRPRYRFDLPDPPMDPKMLLGTLSTASYAKPVITALERDFRPPAIPADPTHGLHANLIESSLYTEPVNLSVDDDALLLSVMAGRPGYTGAKPSADGRRRGLNKDSVSRPTANSTTPWMRRMAYDEYLGGSGTVSRRKPSIKEQEEAAVKLVNDRKNDPKMVQRRRREMLQSFDIARNNPIHPSKSVLRPVHVAPIFPDFFLFGQNLVTLEFDKDEALAPTERTKNDPEDAAESVRSLATLRVETPADAKNGKKVLACYTPNDETLRKRKRLRDEDDKNFSRDGKKRHFADQELYEWIGEYQIRERDLGSNKVDTDLPTRSCFMLSEYGESDSRIALLSRVGSTWKLSKRPVKDIHFGKPDLKIERVSSISPNKKDVEQMVCGVSKSKQSKDMH